MTVNGLLPILPADAGLVRYLVFSGSLRTGSLNTRLARLAADVITAHGGEVDVASMSDFDAPSFDQDAQTERGLPAGALEFQRRLEASDAFVIASPEYNASMPAVLKNAIDWVSRLRPQPFNERHCLLMSASPSMVGGNRGLWALRVPLEHLGSRVYPDMFSLAQAHTAFDERGEIARESLRDRFRATIVNFMSLAEASKHYPCVKSAWIEFLGEEPDPALDASTLPAPSVAAAGSPVAHRQ
jgi:NAD(P)H-dependent FMN reductase